MSGMKYKTGNIVLIVTFFGELPAYFPVFQLSCKYNPDIQWLIFSDCSPPSDCPDNLEFVNFTIDEYCDLASEKLGFDVHISSNYPYKLCDFKPAFGKIYEDYINEFDYWGHCDVDIVWGQIRKFVDPLILNDYQIITSRPNRISGHFCIYKNEKKLNLLFLSMPKTIKLLKLKDHCYHLDEDYFSLYIQWLSGSSPLLKVKRFFGMSPESPKIYWDSTLTTSGEHQRKVSESKDRYLTWEDGRAYGVDCKELMYLHFHELKNTISEINLECSNEVREIHISDKAIKTQ